ncbi:MAG: GntR family transcriptional regulator [Cyclobacteriaceae bacterium]
MLTLEINDNSSLPKYKQVVKSIVDNIESGKITYGQKLPSINQLSFDYYLSRDTVEKAYRDLKRQGIIESVKGKGFYISNSAPESKVKVLVVFNKLSTYKKTIYNSLAHELGERVQIDFFIYHCDFDMFERIINEHLEGYSYYVVMPHFVEFDKLSFLNVINKINREKLIILDQQVEGLDDCHGMVYQDFKMDIYNAMEQGIDALRKYDNLILVFPESVEYPYPKDIVVGFRRFCAFNNFKFEVINEINEETTIKLNSAYVVVEENDLVNLIKIARSSKIKLPGEVGVLSYNDTALKEVLAEGISVITTDFAKMGQLAASMILGDQSGSHKNDFNLIRRASL